MTGNTEVMTFPLDLSGLNKWDVSTTKPVAWTGLDRKSKLSPVSDRGSDSGNGSDCDSDS